MTMKDRWTMYFQGELTDPEKQELFSRIETDKEFKQDFSGLNNIWAISQLLEQPQDAQTAQEGKRRLYGMMKKRKMRSVIFQVFRYAAVICIVSVVSWFLTKNYFSGNEIVYTEIHVPSGQRLHLTLADGSTVWLSPQSRLKLPNEFKRNNRTIELDGEGFFTVTEDDERPFIVKSKGYNVEVLGTKFNLFSYSKNSIYEVHLVKGKVHVYNEENKDDMVFLLPDEKAYLTEGGLMKSPAYYDNEEFLKHGIYNFQATPFIDILEYLALWYDVQFDIKGAVVLTMKVNAKFRLNDDIESILIALQNVFKFNFKRIDDHKIEISK